MAGGSASAGRRVVNYSHESKLRALRRAIGRTQRERDNLPNGADRVALTEQILILLELEFEYERIQRARITVIENP